MPYQDKEKQAEYQRKYYGTRKDQWRQRNVTERARKKEIVMEWKRTHPCTMCGESDPVVLDFHHTDPSQKDSGVADLVASKRSDKRITDEMAKCVMMCKNCHARHHWNETERGKAQ